MFRVLIVCSPPSPVTTTWPGPAMRPAPLIHSALFFLNRNSMPLVSWPTLLSFCACMVGRSSSGVTLMPRAAKSFDAASNISDACSIALDGMHPTFRQVPPRVARFSTHATFMPSCPARMAAL